MNVRSFPPILRGISFGLLLISSSVPGTRAQTTAARLDAPPANRPSVVDSGAVGDGTTLNTERIQSAIDQLAAKGGGTLIVPAGAFLTGALFLKPGVNLHLEKNAVLRCSTDMKNFPEQRVRIEGHFEERFTPALINAKDCDGLRLTGEGTLDGAGRPIWDLFWKLRQDSPDPKNFRNLSIARARLCLIENSRGVVIDGLTFKDSQFWNLHLYRCRDILVQNARFEVPDDYKQAPSTDGIDVDSCQGVTIKRCYFSVTDDCIAMKGSKGPRALEDKDSPPVEHVRISDCVYERGGGVLTLGSEATAVRDVVVENCRVIGPVNVAVLKLRTDTPQTYEDIHFRNLTLDSAGGTLLKISPWSQYADLQGQAPPGSVVRNVTFSGIKGRLGALGEIRGNRGQTAISDLALEDIDVQLKSEHLKNNDAKNLKVRNVMINGKPFMPSGKAE